jgi:FixJ family two-component response regulator
VITDESMPGISGSELIRRLREIRPTIPILLVSGYMSAAVAQRARDAGTDEVLKKPFTARELATSLDRALRGNVVPRPQGHGASALTKSPTKKRRRARDKAPKVRETRNATESG